MSLGKVNVQKIRIASVLIDFLIYLLSWKGFDFWNFLVLDRSCYLSSYLCNTYLWRLTSLAYPCPQAPSFQRNNACAFSLRFLPLRFMIYGRRLSRLELLIIVLTGKCISGPKRINAVNRSDRWRRFWVFFTILEFIVMLTVSISVKRLE